MADFPPKLIYRCEDLQLADMKVRYQKQLIEHERDNIVFANYRIQFYKPADEEMAFANQIIADAQARIKQLSFELRALELHLMEVEKYVLKHDQH